MNTWARREGETALAVVPERFGSTLVIGIDGRLTAETRTEALERIARVMAVSPPCIVLDLERVERLDCAGIGVLVVVHRHVASRGGLVVLAAVQRRQRQQLLLAGLDAVFRLFASRLAAAAWCETAVSMWTARPRRPHAASPTAWTPASEPARETFAAAHSA